MSAKIIIASGPVIVEDGKVLLDLSGTDVFWKFCGGKVKDGERLHHTAVRRAKEELGIDIEIIDPDPFIFWTLKRTVEDDVVDVILAHFLARFTGGIELGHDVHEATWFPLNDLPLHLAPNILPALKHFRLLS